MNGTSLRATISKSEGWAEVSDSYCPPGASGHDPSVVLAARIEAMTPPSTDPTVPTQPGPRVEALLRRNASGALEVDVPGFVSSTACQQAVDAAVAAAAIPEHKVLPEGFSQATSRAADGAITKVRMNVPGGRWVEFDPIANTFLVG